MAALQPSAPATRLQGMGRTLFRHGGHDIQVTAATGQTRTWEFNNNGVLLATGRRPRAGTPIVTSPRGLHPASSRDRPVAAAIARLSAAGQASAAISTSSARLGGARRAGDRTTQRGRILGAGGQQRAGAGHGLARQQPRQVGRDALLDRRLLHQFGQQEHIGRTAARTRR